MAHLNSLSNVLEHLNIQADVIAAQARFYISYAEMLERERSAAQRTDVPPGRENIWTRIANPAQPWLGTATIASTYRLASQYAALVDMPLAMRLAVRASLAYLEAGLPFGLFLATGLLNDSILQHQEVTPRLFRLLSSINADPASTDPVQQVYLLLTLASRPWLGRQLNQSADNMLNHLAAHDLHPVGPQSAPLADYLNLARTMLSNQTSEQPDEPQGQETEQPFDEATDAGISVMAQQLAGIGRSQAASLRITMRNQYLWRNAAAPVNIVDLEQVALYGLATRTGGHWSEQLLQRTTSLLEDNDALAELPGWTCREMNRLLTGMTEEIQQIMHTYSWRGRSEEDGSA